MPTLAAKALTAAARPLAGTLSAGSLAAKILLIANVPLHDLSSESRSDWRCRFDSDFDCDFESIYAIIFLHGLRSLWF